MPYLPTKWISADGRGLAMGFSGRGVNDAFCVRGVQLQVGAPDTTPPAPPTAMRVE